MFVFFSCNKRNVYLFLIKIAFTKLQTFVILLNVCFFGRPYFVKVEPMSQHVVWRLSVCLSSVTICIVAKRHILAKNCLKEQIG